MMKGGVTEEDISKGVMKENKDEKGVSDRYRKREDQEGIFSRLRREESERG